jgi:hypothetical protein
VTSCVRAKLPVDEVHAIFPDLPKLVKPCPLAIAACWNARGYNDAVKSKLGVSGLQVSVAKLADSLFFDPNLRSRYRIGSVMCDGCKVSFTRLHSCTSSATLESASECLMIRRRRNRETYAMG